MKSVWFAFGLGLMLIAGPQDVRALDLSGAATESEDQFRDAQNTFNNRINQQNQRREQFNNRDRWKDACYQLPSGSDIQTACLGDYPYAVDNLRARNILLGNCHAWDSNGLGGDLTYVCNEGPKACSILDGDAAYWCRECNASPRWLATYSLGRIIQCFN